MACGYWPLYSFDPRNEAHPFQLASKKPAGTFKDFAMKEARFAMLGPLQARRFGPAVGPRPAGHRQAVSFLRTVGRREPRDGGRAAAAAATGGNGENKAKDSKEVEA